MARKKKARGKKVRSVRGLHGQSCKIVTTSRHQRCFCNGKLSPHKECGLTKEKARGHHKSTCKAAPTKIPGTDRYRCKTWGGGSKFVAKEQVAHERERIRIEKLRG